MAQIEKALRQVLRWEGGYQDHPNDSGNYNSKGQLVGTNHGISAPVAEHFLGFPPDRFVMKKMSLKLAVCIYRQNFWENIKGDQIESQPVANIFFDGHVNHGRWGIRLMQEILGVSRDGIVGPITLAALNETPPEIVYTQYKERRIEFYHAIVKRSPEMGVFLRGWLNRINSFRHFSNINEYQMALVAVNNRSIEFASPVVRDLAVVISQAVDIDKNRDKKIDLGEWFSFGQILASALFRQYGNANDALADFRDANSLERKELIAVFTEGFDLPNDTAETIIEETLAFVEDFATRGADLFGRWADLVRDSETA